MDLSTAGNLADIIGSLGTMLALIFFGYELSKTTKESQGNIDNYIGDAFRPIDLLMLQDESISALILKGRDRPEELTSVESLRYRTYLKMTLDIWELGWDRRRQNMVSRENWADWEFYFNEWGKEYLYGLHWLDLKWEYGDSLVEYIDRVLKEPMAPNRETPFTGIQQAAR